FADHPFDFLADGAMTLWEKAARFVVRTLENIVGHEIPALNAPFSALHLTSLHIVRFLDFWQVVFGTSLQFTIFYEHRNVKTLVEDVIARGLLAEEHMAAAAAFLTPAAEEHTEPAFPLSELQESFVIGRQLST
ncbi:hypothetical protein, partial [Xenorhabdus bovienii]|uniref:hypothetical protein n=1 Tax=Xenorhabdus bovienii TaxID=40576 RepID=UPI0023B295D7